MFSDLEIRRIHKVLSNFCSQWSQSSLSYVVDDQSVQVFSQENNTLLMSLRAKKRFACLRKQSVNGTWSLFCTDGRRWLPYVPSVAERNIEKLLDIIKSNPNRVFF